MPLHTNDKVLGRSVDCTYALIFYAVYSSSFSSSAAHRTNIYMSRKLNLLAHLVSTVRNNRDPLLCYRDVLDMSKLFGTSLLYTS